VVKIEFLPLLAPLQKSSWPPLGNPLLDPSWKKSLPKPMPPMLCFRSFARILIARIDVQVTKYHKGKTAKSACKTFTRKVKKKIKSCEQI